MLDTVTARAPGRVNLIGEHLDYNGGCCLPIAIPQATTAVVRRIDGDRLRLSSGESSWAGGLDERPDGWPAYLVGVLAALGVRAPLEITISSDVPIGAGLSSSAALECSVALAVDTLLGLGHSRDELAAACIRAENDYVGAPTGGMDQAIALFAEAEHALAIDFAANSQTQVPFSPGSAGLALLVIDTRVAHRLVDGQYAARRADCGRAAGLLGAEHLAEVADAEDALATLAKTATEQVRRRARHVFTEQQRVLDAVAALGDDDWPGFGALLNASHASLRDDYEVSCTELDTAVAAAQAAGALGARMTGGGFGGSAIALVPLDRLAGVRDAVAAGFAENGWDAPTQFQVEASRGAVVLPGVT